MILERCVLVLAGVPGERSLVLGAQVLPKGSQAGEQWVAPPVQRHRHLTAAPACLTDEAAADRGFAARRTVINNKPKQTCTSVVVSSPLRACRASPVPSFGKRKPLTRNDARASTEPLTTCQPGLVPVRPVAIKPWARPTALSARVFVPSSPLRLTFAWCIITLTRTNWTVSRAFAVCGV